MNRENPFGEAAAPVWGSLADPEEVARMSVEPGTVPTAPEAEGPYKGFVWRTAPNGSGWWNWEGEGPMPAQGPPLGTKPGELGTRLGDPEGSAGMGSHYKNREGKNATAELSECLAEAETVYAKLGKLIKEAKPKKKRSKKK